VSADRDVITLLRNRHSITANSPSQKPRSVTPLARVSRTPHHKSKRRDQAGVGKNRERPTLGSVERRRGRTEQHRDHAVGTGGTAHPTVLAVDEQDPAGFRLGGANSGGHNSPSGGLHDGRDQVRQSARLRRIVGAAAYGPGMSAITTHQASFEDLGTPLRDVTFVVVDLETTGGSAESCAITEIGAVKVRGGERLGEFQTLVDPGQPVPPFIAVLTGITDAMLVGAPVLRSVLPAFLQFADGAVLVAHNAGFDIGFLKAACRTHGHPWPGAPVLDTLRLARAVLARDEVRNCKLATLAAHFRATTEPSHRALHDARATVDVLHGLIERVGTLGVTDLEELLGLGTNLANTQVAKRGLAAGLPSAPGVYIFADETDTPLYVGTSRDIRRRVRSYFTAGETRSRMAEMIGLAHHVTPIVCATDLEAQVREIRLIAEYRPRYNRRSKSPERAPWLKLTAEAFPRLSIVREVRDDVDSGAAYLGPFSGAGAAQAAAEAILAAVPLRTCTARIGVRSRLPACILAEVGRCGAPCRGEQTTEQYGPVAAAARAAMSGDVREVTTAIAGRMTLLAGQERYEEAAGWRDRLESFLRAGTRTERHAMLLACPEVVAARPRSDLGWDIHVIRFGRLAGAAAAPLGLDPRTTAMSARTAAATVAKPTSAAGAAWPEETGLILRWLDGPDVRLVELTGELSLPLHGAASVPVRRTEPIGLERPTRGDRTQERPRGLGGGPLGGQRRTVLAAMPEPGPLNPAALGSQV
jgi:DNA polymerase-3 subunit epsilon